jgi:hypothetical protein
MPIPFTPMPVLPTAGCCCCWEYREGDTLTPPPPLLGGALLTEPAVDDAEDEVGCRKTEPKGSNA